MCGGIKGWSWFDPTDDLLELRGLKKFFLALIDVCQNAQYIDAVQSGPSNSGGSCPGLVLL